MRQRKVCNDLVIFRSGVSLSVVTKEETKRWTARYLYPSLQGHAVRTWHHIGEFAPSSANTENRRSRKPAMEKPMTDVEPDGVEYNVVTFGAAQVNPSFAIRLKQIEQDISACLIEKSSVIDAHILPGAVIKPDPFDALRRSFCAAD